MIKYKTENWSSKIFKVEVEKETEYQIIINGRRSNKMSEYECFFDTFEDAKEYLIEKISKEIKNLQWKLSREQNKLNKIMLIEIPSNDKGV